MVDAAAEVPDVDCNQVDVEQVESIGLAVVQKV